MDNSNVLSNHELSQIDKSEIFEKGKIEMSQEKGAKLDVSVPLPDVGIAKNQKINQVLKTSDQSSIYNFSSN